MAGAFTASLPGAAGLAAAVLDGVAGLACFFTTVLFGAGAVADFAAGAAEGVAGAAAGAAVCARTTAAVISEVKMMVFILSLFLFSFFVGPISYHPHEPIMRLKFNRDDPTRKRAATTSWGYS